MRAAVLHDIGDLRVEDAPLPAPKAGEVDVRVRACGICGSDVPRILSTGTYRFPTIPGHELSGVVDAVGAGVDPDLRGRRVAVVPLIPCGRCRSCEVAEYAQCTDYDFAGSRRDGGFAEHVTVPAANLLPLPDDVSFAQGAMLEPTTVALKAVRNVGVHANESVVVFGFGAIGALVAQWARRFGARRVVVVEVSGANIALAHRLGFDEVIDGAALSPDGLEPLLAGGPFEVAFDAAGSGAAMENAVRVLAARGRLGLIGRPGSATTMSTAFFERILRQQLTVSGSWSFEFKLRSPHSWHEAAEAMSAGVIDVAPLITRTIGLDGILQTVTDMRSGAGDLVKTIVDPTR